MKVVNPLSESAKKASTPVKAQRSTQKPHLRSLIVPSKQLMVLTVKLPIAPISDCSVPTRVMLRGQAGLIHSPLTAIQAAMMPVTMPAETQAVVLAEAEVVVEEAAVVEAAAVNSRNQKRNSLLQ